jgi:hypothetical protein
VRDQAGANPKDRPAVIVTKTDEISTSTPFAAVAVTGTFSYPLASALVELPSSPSGHATTGLYKRCVAVCDWLLAIQVSDVISTGGVVPEHILRRILLLVARLSP